MAQWIGRVIPNVAVSRPNLGWGQNYHNILVAPLWSVYLLHVSQCLIDIMYLKLGSDEGI